MIALFAPFDLNNVYGNTLRPIMQAKGLEANGFRDFIIYCNSKNDNLSVNQREISHGILSRVPGSLRHNGIPFVYDMPIVKKQSFPDDIDVLHAHNYYSILALENDLDRGLILDYHTLKSVSLTDKYRAHRFGRVYDMLFTSLVRKIEESGTTQADRVIVASRDIKRGLINNFGLAAAKITTINNMVDVDAFSHNTYEDNFDVGVIGPFEHQNRDTVSALEHLGRHTDIEIKVIGSIANRDRVALERYDNISVLGWVQQEAYHEFIGSVGAILLPYFRNLGGGGTRNKLLEAAAAGTPVVSTRSGARGFEETENLLVGDDIEDLISHLKHLENDPNLRERLGTQLRYVAETKYDYRGESRKLIDVYDSVR